LSNLLRIELSVAFSRRGQPVWFRVTKWIVAIGLGWLLWGTPYLWWVIAGASSAALSLHLLWRRKTNRWTRPWGGWTDVDPSRGSRPRQS
jgi:hypothetical protein